MNFLKKQLFLTPLSTLSIARLGVTIFASIGRESAGRRGGSAGVFPHLPGPALDVEVDARLVSNQLQHRDQLLRLSLRTF